MIFFQSKLALSLFFFYYLSLLKKHSTQTIKDENSLCANCSISEHKRCIKNSNNQGECRCLRGLFQQDDRCLGVIRYDMNLTLFYSSRLKSYKKIYKEVDEFFKNIPDKSKDILVNSNYGMDIEEREIYLRDANPKVFAKLVYWKKDQTNPKDLPSIDLDQMKTFMQNYFRSNLRGGPNIDSVAYIDNLDIGSGEKDSLIKNFIESFILRYNQFTCKTEKLNYCYNHEWCKPNLGSVECECDRMTSVDVSPEKELFPGEKCNKGCSKKCDNEGICRLKEKEYVCYCLGWYVGEHCQISIIWFIIVAASLIFIFLLLSTLCGFFDFFSKKKQKKISSKQKEEINDENKKRF